jgi:hypothetical protein
VRARSLTFVAGFILVVSAACGGPQPSATGVPTAAPSAPSPSAPPTRAAPAASALTAGDIDIDAGLLDLLPEAVSGVPLVPDLATAAQIASSDPLLAESIAAFAVATAFGPQSTDGNVDLVVVTVARLRPGVFSDDWFRDWRESFDEAVCAQAGGLDGHAETEIDGHQTFIATCAGGVRTYQAHLPSSDVIVSMQATGEGRFGERVVEGLTE